MPLRAIPEKQRKFFAEYEVDHNGTQAAIRAGYAVGSAYVTASRLLKKAREQPEVAKVPAQLQRAIAKRVERQTGIDVTSSAYVIEKAIEVVEYCIAMRPVIGMFGPIADPETGELLLEMTDPKGATTALALLAKRHPEFRDATINVDARTLNVTTRGKLSG